ncbi:TetR/AcrR family transcriptional regulator [Mycobacterium sp.]|uniref:TetR/AcrR family transcriptional regulator n=1 Tax=Mycobacterium sp. TaxID=1785 RepID=UPI002600AED2|nr:TetR/AcrR family transcriptional regulator [Mycobacterium sp.]
MSDDSTPRRRRTQRERVAESTSRLVAAAIQLIAEKGFSNTSIAEIGERAGYSRSMVQSRYRTKEMLLESLLREEYESRLLDAQSTAGTGLEQLLGQVDRLHNEVVINPELMRGFYALCFESITPVPSLRAWITDWLERYEAATEQAIQTGIADGSIRPDIDPRSEARAFVASGLGYAFRWMVAPTIGYEALLRQWQGDVRKNLQAAPSSPAG